MLSQILVVAHGTGHGCPSSTEESLAAGGGGSGLGRVGGGLLGTVVVGCTVGGGTDDGGTDDGGRDGGAGHSGASAAAAARCSFVISRSTPAPATRDHVDGTSIAGESDDHVNTRTA